MTDNKANAADAKSRAADLRSLCVKPAHKISMISKSTMEFRQHTQNDSSAIESLFTSVFAKSEGEAEGELIENLSKELMLETAEDDLFGFVAVDKNQIVGSIFLVGYIFKMIIILKPSSWLQSLYIVTFKERA